MVETLDRESLKALSTDTRQDIIKMLSKRPHTASEMSKILDKHVTTVTEHLSVLERSGLIKRKDSTNKWVYYALTEKGDKLFKPAYYSWVITLAMVFIVAAILLVGLTGIMQNNITGGFAAKGLQNSEVQQVSQLSANIMDSSTNSVPVEITTPTTRQTISMQVSNQNNTVKLKMSNLGNVVPVIIEHENELRAMPSIAGAETDESSNDSSIIDSDVKEQSTGDKFEMTMDSEHFEVEVKDPVMVGDKIVVPVEIRYTETDNDTRVSINDRNGKTRIIEIEKKSD